MTTLYRVLRVWFSAANTDASGQGRSCAALLLMCVQSQRRPAIRCSQQHQIPAKQASGKQDKQQKAHHEQTDTHPFAPVDPLAKNERAANDAEQNLDLAQRGHIGHRL
jgi:hypothetical protein